MGKITVILIALATGLFLHGAAAAETLTAVLSVDPVAKISNDRLVITITGTYRCGPIPASQSPSNWGMLSGTLAQVAGREIAKADWGLQPVCDNQPQTFEYGVHATTIPWHGGKIRVTARLNVQVCQDYSTCDTASSSVDQQLSIRGGNN